MVINRYSVHVFPVLYVHKHHKLDQFSYYLMLQVYVHLVLTLSYTVHFTVNFSVI